VYESPVLYTANLVGNFSLKANASNIRECYEVPQDMTMCLRKGFQVELVSELGLEVWGRFL
jgi:hypothetical protein